MRGMMKIGAAVLAMGAALPATAAQRLWTITGGTFEDGGTFSGSFVYDAETNAYSNVAITTSASGSNYGQFYTIPSDGTQSRLGFVTNRTVGDRFTSFFVTFTAPLTDEADRRDVNALFSRESYSVGDGSADSGRRFVSDGTITSSAVTAAVPEPGTWLLLIAGFGAAGAVLRRRSRLRVAAPA